MTVLHSGATKKYSDNWELAFGGKRAGRKSKQSGSTRRGGAKKAAKKKTAARAGAAAKKRPAKTKR